MRQILPIISVILIIYSTNQNLLAAPATKGNDSAKDSRENLPSPFATVLSIVPGAVIHGVGHFYAGEKTTGIKLLKWEAIGLSAFTTAGLYYLLSGGSRYGNELAMPLMVAGGGLFLQTMISDVVGSMLGPSKELYRYRPSQSVELGYAYLYDSIFEFHHFTTLQAFFSWKQLKLTPSLWLAVDNNHQQFTLPIQYKKNFGQRGEMWYWDTASTFQRFGLEHFNSTVLETTLGAQIHLARLGPSLSGSYVNAKIGYGLQFIRYNAPIKKTDSSGLSIIHIGFKRLLSRNGNFELYYKHRRDKIVGGISPGEKNGSGFLGYFGATSELQITPGYFVTIQAEMGSSWLGKLGIEVVLGQENDQ